MSSPLRRRSTDRDDSVVIAMPDRAVVARGLTRLPAWSRHLLLLGATAVISGAVYASGEAGSPYTIFFVWVVIYSAFVFGRWGTALQVGGMLMGYAIALLLLGEEATTPVLHWAIAASALVLLAVAVQALTGRLERLVARMSEIGRADSLTGLYNAAAFTDLLDNEVERARRSGNRLGLVIAEIDGFSPVSSGPMAAEQRQMLTGVGSVFRSTPRQIDICARLGGGRFGLLLPYTDEHGGFLVAERIRERVASLGVKMTFGVAGFPRGGAAGQAVFQGAETALSEAREAGGDRVVIFQRSASSARVEIGRPDITQQPLN